MQQSSNSVVLFGIVYGTGLVLRLAGDTRLYKSVPHGLRRKHGESTIPRSELRLFQ